MRCLDCFVGDCDLVVWRGLGRIAGGLARQLLERTQNRTADRPQGGVLVDEAGRKPHAEVARESVGELQPDQRVEAERLERVVGA